MTSTSALFVLVSFTSLQTVAMMRRLPLCRPSGLEALHGRALCAVGALQACGNTRTIHDRMTRVPHVRMQMDRDADRDIPEVWKPNLKNDWQKLPGIKSHPTWHVTDVKSFHLDVFGESLSELFDGDIPIGVDPLSPLGRAKTYQVFPPSVYAQINGRNILLAWEKAVQKSGLQRLNHVLVNMPEADKTGDWDPNELFKIIQLGGKTRSPAQKAIAAKWDDMALVLRKMQSLATLTRAFKVADFIGTARDSDVRNNAFEAVALIPNDFFALDASVLAIGVFARRMIEDNVDGSLRSMVEEQFGEAATRRFDGRRKTKFSVFTIEGLAEAPDLSARSARVLLKKITKWAVMEKNLVVVASHSIHNQINSKDADLTEYYMRLGFRKVETAIGCFDLVYPALSPQDMTAYDEMSSNPDRREAYPVNNEPDFWIEDRQLMVRLDVF